MAETVFTTLSPTNRKINIYLPPLLTSPIPFFGFVLRFLHHFLFAYAFFSKLRNRKSRDPRGGPSSREVEKKAKARDSRTTPFVIISVLICVYLCTMHLSKSSLSFNPIQNRVRTKKEAHKWVHVSLRVYQRKEAGRCGVLGVE